MAKDRLEPCKYYDCEGSCEKNRAANFHGYCQTCNKYEPRAKVKHLNKKKKEIQKLRERDMTDY